MPYFKQPEHPGLPALRESMQNGQNLHEDFTYGSIPYFMQKNPATENMSLEDIIKKAHMWHLRMQNSNPQQWREQRTLERLMREQEQFAPFPARDMKLMPNWQPFRGRIM